MRLFRCRIEMLTLAFAAMGGAAAGEGTITADAVAVAEVQSGRRTEAVASWWGFDSDDATESLQAAIDSGARTVIVPYLGRPWIVRPIRLRSELELLFEPGVLVLAKAGEFRGRNDSLFTAIDAHDIVLRGYGATLRMRKADYASDAYEKAEWRMVLNLRGCERIEVTGLRIEGSGGDGIYLGATQQLPYCKDVVIRDVVCHDNYRQGISVIGAENLLIENCVLSDTGGTAPRAGIDFEPNHAREKLVNCVMRHCTIAGNEGPGFLAYLKNLSQDTDPVSIRVENCLITSGNDTGIVVGAVGDNGPQGIIEFINCTIEGSRKGGARIYDKSADHVRVRFVNCKWNEPHQETAAADAAGGTRLIHLRRPEITRRQGGVEFVDCRVWDSLDRPGLLVEHPSETETVDVTGTLTIHNPHRARMALPATGADVALSIDTGG